MSGTPRRLGRGLAALMGDSVEPAGPHAAQTVAVDMLSPSPFQPRKQMDDRALEELSQSIRQRGILQPLLVRPVTGKPGQFQIVAGERRWRAAQRVPLHEVPVLVRDLSDEDAMKAGLVENLQRTDLNPIEEAEGYQRLIQDFSFNQEALGEMLGKSRSHISNTLRILKLPEAVLAHVRQGVLSMGHARALLMLKDPVRGAEDVVQRGLSVRQTEELVERANSPAAITLPRTAAAAAPVDTDIEALARRLSEQLGIRVKISFDGRKGAVTLIYQSLDQLDSLLMLLER